MKMKLSQYASLGLVALTLSLSASTLWAADDIIVGPSGSQTGTSGAAPDFEWQNMWGGAFASITFDTANPPPTGNTAGAIYIQGNYTIDAQDDLCIGSPGNWWGALNFDASQYTSIEMDIKYDTTSTILPTSQAHLNIGFDQGYNPIYVTNVSFDATSQAVANGAWHHLSIPVPSTISAPVCHSVAFYQWNPSARGTMNFWVANVKVIARVVATPPPTISPLAKASKGFNVIFNTGGAYDRHEARLQDVQGTTPAAVGSGKSWVGNATVGNPVVYTFTINSFPPISVAYPSGCESYLFLVPNPSYNDNAPDWNEPTAMVASIQQGTNTATLTLQYKINEPNNNAMYGGGSQTVTDGATYTNYVSYIMPVGSLPGGGITNVLSPGVLAITNETGNLGSLTVTNSSAAGAAVGNWAIKFTSDTAVTIIGPDGTSASFTIPSYNVGNFAETTGFNVYLGGQPNQAVAFNAAVVYSSFAVSNTVSPFYDNFLADTSLSTNNWDTSVSSGPAGKLVVPATAVYWAVWSLPASGFGLETGSSLNSLSTWTSPSIYPAITLNGSLAQLVDKSELPAGNTAFFNLIKRTFTQLQILLPGQTNAPGTTLGYVGTPTPQSVSEVTPITVNAVDATFHIINGVSDSIHITTTDTSALLPNDTALNNGTVTISGANGFQFGTQPATSTITATDTTSTNIAPVTSSPVSVGP